MSLSLTRRVAGVFATKVAIFAMGLLTTYLLARLLGPSGRGAYYLALLLPVTLVTLGQFGIPAALTFMAGRGVSMDGLRTTAGALAIILSLACVVPAMLARDFLIATILPGTSEFSVTVAIAAVPFLFLSAFSIALLLGRLAIQTSNLLVLGQASASTVLLIAVVAVAGWGVDGAVAVFFGVSAGVGTAAAVAVGLHSPFERASLEPLRPLLGYAIKIYPGSLAAFFSYRADVFLLSILTGSASVVGLYALAVSLAELLFYIADSVSTAFFPHVAAADRLDADRQMPDICRTTLLITASAAIAMIPFVVLGIRVALPAFIESIQPFIVILPGIVALSISKVLSGYVSGIGRPGSAGSTSVASLIVNISANLLLIPSLGIIGAALASTISYSVEACLMVALACRLANVRPRALLVPTLSDVRRLLRAGASLTARRSSPW